MDGSRDADSSEDDMFPSRRKRAWRNMDFSYMEGGDGYGLSDQDTSEEEGEDGVFAYLGDPTNLTTDAVQGLGRAVDFKHSGSGSTRGGKRRSTNRLCFSKFSSVH